MIKIAIATATRAEYGILYPLISKLYKDKDINLQLLVTGTHLLEVYGNTQKEIEQDGFPIYKKMPILENGNMALDISLSMSNAIRQFALYFRDEKPNFVIILGDRTEMLGICCAAMNEKIPIAHLHGGELTEGAIDDCVRHAITKLSFLHFPSTEIYRNRIIQMGEQPQRVYNVGALGVENILNTTLIERDELCSLIGIPKDKKYVIVTFHPVTMENDSESNQIINLIRAMKQREEYFYLITKANADEGGNIINIIFEEYAQSHKDVKLVASLGRLRYLSAVKYSSFVMGNSSSGIIEAPSLGTPTVNIGNRQKGRVMAGSIINCKAEVSSILDAMEMAERMEHRVSYLYGDGNTSQKIIDILKMFTYKGKINLQKRFFDIKVNDKDE